MSSAQLYFTHEKKTWLLAARQQSGVDPTKKYKTKNKNTAHFKTRCLMTRVIISAPTLTYRCEFRFSVWAARWVCAGSWSGQCPVSCAATCWRFPRRAGGHCEWEVLTPPCTHHRLSPPKDPITPFTWCRKKLHYNSTVCLSFTLPASIIFIVYWDLLTIYGISQWTCAFHFLHVWPKRYVQSEAAYGFSSRERANSLPWK